MAIAKVFSFTRTIAQVQRCINPLGVALICAARLKALHPDLPVVIVTAYGSIEDAAEAIRGGAFHYLPKPLQPGQVLAVVKTVGHHVHAILNKLALTNRIQAALVAQRCGMDGGV